MANVLIVDDAKIMRINIKSILEKLGHTIVAETDNGYAGIEEYKKHNPDFVTMDITMPEQNNIKDGIDAVASIKEYDSKATIIMVTSHGEEQKVRKAIKAGAKNYILKPINAPSLEKVIKKLGF